MYTLGNTLLSEVIKYNYTVYTCIITRNLPYSSTQVQYHYCYLIIYFLTRQSRKKKQKQKKVCQSNCQKLRNIKAVVSVWLKIQTHCTKAFLSFKIFTDSVLQTPPYLSSCLHRNQASHFTLQTALWLIEIKKIKNFLTPKILILMGKIYHLVNR